MRSWEVGRLGSKQLVCKELILRLWGWVVGRPRRYACACVCVCVCQTTWCVRVRAYACVHVCGCMCVMCVCGLCVCASELAHVSSSSYDTNVFSSSGLCVCASELRLLIAVCVCLCLCMCLCTLELYVPVYIRTSVFRVYLYVPLFLT